MRTRPLLALALTACQPNTANPGFVSTPELTSATSTADAGSSSNSDTTAAEGDASVADSEPIRDLGGLPDFGDSSPIGCKGKIDLLFVISNAANMDLLQERLTAAFPAFIATIESKFADFDYHIMVVDGDERWGSMLCNELCPELDCKVGEPCCSVNVTDDAIGQPCCSAPDYPCDQMDLLSGCDRMWGSGSVFPAGPHTFNEPCPIDGGRRYLVKGQTDLVETFQCIATVGSSGWGSIGQALVAAVQKPINAVGGCNKGFLRDDALLMATFISVNPDSAGSESDGTPAQWAEAVLAAKHSDPESIVMLSILYAESDWESPYDRIGTMAKMFPYHHLERCTVLDYAPAFNEAANLVEAACDGFEPPPQ